MSIRIAFVGAGRMASAIVRGLLDKKHYLPEEIACTGGSGPSAPRLAEETGIQFLPDIRAAIQEAEAVVIACKPQQIPALDPGIVASAEGTLIVSVLAGTTLARLQDKFPKARNIVRTMPNTPGQIGAGVTAYAPLHTLDARDTAIVKNALGSLGNFHEVAESDLDAVTGVSGSGPAYVFEFAAALRDAGCKAGLDKTLSESLAIDTLLGAAKLLAASSDSPEALRDAVTSPKGTTAAGLQVLHDNDFRGLLEQVVAAAKARSLELAKG